MSTCVDRMVGRSLHNEQSVSMGDVHSQAECSFVIVAGNPMAEGDNNTKLGCIIACVCKVPLNLDVLEYMPAEWIKNIFVYILRPPCF